VGGGRLEKEGRSRGTGEWNEGAGKRRGKRNWDFKSREGQDWGRVREIIDAGEQNKKQSINWAQLRDWVKRPPKGFGGSQTERANEGG